MIKIQDYRCLYCIKCFSGQSVHETHSKSKEDESCVSLTGCGICQDNNNLCKTIFEQNHKKGKIFSDYIKNNRRDLRYDVMVMFSGGKDSIYVLNQLKKNYKLNVLAFTISHPYKTLSSTNNIKRVIESLDIDHITLRLNKSGFINSVRKFLSGNEYRLPGLQKLICGFCTAVLIVNTYILAYQLGIPYVLYCADPNQLKTIPLDFLYFARFIKNLQLGNTINQIVDLDMINQIIESKPEFPKLVSPFACLLEYNVKEIIQDINTLGINSNDIDPENTNCELQPLIKYFSFKKYNCYRHVYYKYFSLDKSNLSEEEITAIINDYKKIYREIACQDSISKSDINFIKKTLNKLYAYSEFKSSANKEFEHIMHLKQLLDEIMENTSHEKQSL